MKFHPYITTFEIMHRAGWGAPSLCAECGEHERHWIHRYHELTLRHDKLTIDKMLLGYVKSKGDINVKG